MSSSPIAPATAAATPPERLLTHLARVPDPRDPRGVRYPLVGLLAGTVSAVLAGGTVVRRGRGMGSRPDDRVADPARARVRAAGGGGAERLADGYRLVHVVTEDEAARESFTESVPQIAA